MGFLARVGHGINSIGQYFRESWAELKKVRWPHRQELRTYTAIVVITVLFLSLFFAVIDLLITYLLELLL